MGMAMRINLGSYIYPLSGYVNVDIERWDGVDVVYDLSKLPWPFDDGVAQHIRAVDILEHLGKLTKVEAVGELARITRKGGTVEIRVPLCTNAISLQSLQHAHAFYIDSFQNSYVQPWFELESRSISFFKGRLDVPFVTPLHHLMRVLCRLGFGYCITFQLRKL